jgi:endo-1,4-beta-xylanase
MGQGTYQPINSCGGNLMRALVPATLPPGLLALLLAGVPSGSAEAQKAADPLAPEAIRQRIRQHRTAEATLTVVGAGGKPLANTAVVIHQTRHQFLFGCNAFALNPADDGPAQRAYQKRFAALFNYATLPFYWGAYEPEQGKPAAERLRRLARWCIAHGVTAKGHPLCWHEVQPRWLVGKAPEEVLKLQLARIRRDVAAFAGTVDVWDVVNEAVVMPDHRGGRPELPALCRKLGRVELLRQTFAAARAANPRAVLALNDYNTSAKYEALIRDALAAKVPVDVVGIQSHMHGGYWGARRVWEVCERFARLGRPLHFTEATILGGPRKEKLDYRKYYKDWLPTPEEEKRQSEQAREFYTVLFSHPAVRAITWWDFSDRGAWLGAPAGLLRRDMTPKPAYEALRKLIKGEWWTAEVKATTDAAGQVRLRGFLGEYAVTAQGAAGTFRLERPGAVRVRSALAAP